MDDLMRYAIGSIGEGVVIADDRGQIVYLNPIAEKIIGQAITKRPPDEWSDHFGIYYPDTTTPFPSDELPLVRALKGETVKDFELFLRNPGVPEGVFVRCTATPIMGLFEDFKGAIVVFSDITKQVEEKKKLLAMLEEAQNSHSSR